MSDCMRILVTIFIILLVNSCTPSAKFAQKKSTLPAFRNSGQVRTDGFYYSILPTSNPEPKWRYFVEVMVLFDDGTLVGSQGFSTGDTSITYIRSHMKTRMNKALEVGGHGWGRYMVEDNKLTKEFWIGKSKGFRNVGIAMQEATIQNDGSILFGSINCSWCDFLESRELPFYFEPFQYKPDSSKAIFR